MKLTYPGIWDEESSSNDDSCLEQKLNNIGMGHLHPWIDDEADEDLEVSSNKSLSDFSSEDDEANCSNKNDSKKDNNNNNIIPAVVVPRSDHSSVTQQTMAMMAITMMAFLINNLQLLIAVSCFLPPKQAILLVEKLIPKPEKEITGFETMRTMWLAGLSHFDVYKLDFYSPLCMDSTHQMISLTAKEIKEYQGIYEPFFCCLKWDYSHQEFI